MIVSDEDPTELARTAAAFRAQGCLAKPFDLDQLLELVGRYTG